MTYDPSKYEERQAANDRSRQFAHRDGQPWTEADDAVLLQEWIFKGPEHRHESQVAKDLARTIEACRNRAHFLRGIHTGIRYNKSEERPPVVCTGCWLELPATGTCPNCE